MYFSQIGIIGCGKMGTDILNYLYPFNYKIVMVCKSQTNVEKLIKTITRKNKRNLRMGIIDENEFNTLSQRILITTNIKALNNSDLIIETITENINFKKDLFTKIHKYISPHCILCTNSSSILPTDITSDNEILKKFIGLHFFYPLKLKNFIEINTTQYNTKKTIDKIKLFIESINKKYIVLDENCSFIINKLFLDVQAEAFRLVKEKKIPYDVMDAQVKQHLFSFGVFDFIDNVGIDVMHESINNYTQNEVSGDFYTPMLTKLSALRKENKLGVKSGQGFYQYTNNTDESNDIQLNINTQINHLRYIYLNSALKIIEKNICNKELLESIIIEYFECEKKPISQANEIGAKKIYNYLMGYYNETGYIQVKPSNLLLTIT